MLPFAKPKSSTSSPAIESSSAFASFALKREPATHLREPLYVAGPTRGGNDVNLRERSLGLPPPKPSEPLV